MSNICLVSFCNIYYLPYAKQYIDIIQKNGCQCTLIFWDRDAVNGMNDNFADCKKIIYQKKITPEQRPSNKLLDYIKASKFFSKALKDGVYDGVVLLQTHAAVFCAKALKKYYSGKYIVDIRDYTWENIKIYKCVEDRVLRNAYAVVISSPAYRSFLPSMDYIVSHNYSPFLLDRVNEIKNRRKSINHKIIRISFVGTIRFLEMDKKILNLFANDKRYQINYYGNGSEVLKEYCISNGIENVDFYGAFPPEMTLDFYEKTDIINNLYGNNDNYLDYALSNKLYHAAQLCIPILVCPNTYMEEISKEYNMGCVLDVNDEYSPNKLYDWYNNFSFDELSDGCNRFLDRVISENSIFVNEIDAFVKMRME